MSMQKQYEVTTNIVSKSKFSPNVSYQGREIRILAGAALIITFMLFAPTPVGWWGLSALIAVPIIASGMFAWDPVYALFGINRYNEVESDIHQRSWSCPNVGTVDRIARLIAGILLLATAFTSTDIAWQSVTTLLSIPVIMSAIMAWDPLYALAYTNTFASKSDVQSADPDQEETTLVKFYHFPQTTSEDKARSLERAA